MQFHKSVYKYNNINISKNIVFVLFAITNFYFMYSDTDMYVHSTKKPVFYVGH